jgi:SAM-dependent methyltransferase
MTASTALEIYRQVHRIAFAPMTFQAARIARDRGLLRAAEQAGKKGINPDEAVAATGLSLYAVRLLLEACLSLDLLMMRDWRFHLTSAGRILLHDPLVRANMDFTHDVCYQGAFALEESLLEGRPAGLQALGDFPTVYAGLMQLPEQVRHSWFRFDHIYSDGAFPTCLDIVFDRPLGTLLDVGANTGRWALLCAGRDPQVQITLLDHAAQLAEAQKSLDAAGYGGRVRGIATDLLNHGQPFPTGMDVVWMSQLLDCFGEDDILGLLRRGAQALAENGRLFIVETYWDRQPNLPARDAVIASSLYFACIANGRSRMYHSDDLSALIAQAGLRIQAEHQIGFHTLRVCVAQTTP